MDSLWMITATNVFIVFLMLGIPVLLLALGISLGLRLARVSELVGLVLPTQPGEQMRWSGPWAFEFSVP